MSDTPVPHGYILWIYYIYRSVGFGIGIQTCSRVYLKGCAHNQKDISRLNDINGSLYLGYGLAEPYDVRSELGTVRCKVADVDGLSLYQRQSAPNIRHGRCSSFPDGPW